MMRFGIAAVLWLLFAGLLVVGTVVLVRTSTERGGSSGSSRSASSAFQILEERFVRDDIDRDEFEERRRALRS